MKNSLFIFVFLLITRSVRAQSPQKMSYQAVIRDAGNILVTNHAIGMRVSLLQGSASGTEVFKEIYNPNPQTNANGLVSIEIGSGLALTGNFATINWANGPYFIKTETDPVGGTNYSITGVSQLLSVPYALFAANGTPGAQGNTGNTGVAGLAGNTGASGASGIAGTMGLSGKTGATGSNGATGATGTIVSGTIGQTLRHDGTNWAANSFLLNSGSAIGIGTAAPSQALDVTGNIQSSGQFKSTLATGTAPFTLNSSTLNTNLNADLLDGQHYTSNWKLWSDSSAYITPNNASNFRIYDNTGYGSLLSVASTSTSSVTNFTNGTVNSKDAYNFLSTTYSYYGSGGNYGAFGSGSTYGIYGEFQSTPTRYGYLGGSNVGAFGQFDANHYGALGTGSCGVIGYNYGSSSGSAGVYGFNGGLSIGNAGVYGFNGGQGFGTPGVYGYNTSSIFGTSNIRDSSMNGIVGYVSNGIQHHYGVFGSRYDDAGGPSAGVFGSVNYNSGGSGWGALGYQNASSTEFAGYFKGKLALDAPTGFYSSFSTTTQTANINYVLPENEGTAGTVLYNYGSGILAWDKPSNFVYAASGNTLTLSTSCQNYSSITIFAPFAGVVVVDASVMVNLDHTAGIDDFLRLCIGTDATDVGSNYWNTFWTIPYTAQTFFASSFSFRVQRVFSVNAGVHTFYLNGFMLSGANTDNMYWSGMTAEFK